MGNIHANGTQIAVTDERYREIEWDPYILLTEEEMREGWHFCQEWDFMLVGPGMREQDGCLCFVNKGNMNVPNR